MEFIKNLKKALSEELPGPRAHRSFFPLRESMPVEKTSYMDSAIGIHIYPYKNSYFTLLIEKSVFKGPHSGQMAFPGGKKENHDVHLESTARRESFEEIGIHVNEGIVLGKLTEVYIPVSKFCIHPFIFYHESLPKLLPNYEVASLEKIDLNELLKSENTGTTTIQHQQNIYLKNIPCFVLNNRVVWGATALILSELKEILLKIKEDSNWGDTLK